MANENGIEVIEAKAEEVGGSASPVAGPSRMPTAAELQAALDRLSPQERQQLFAIGSSLGQAVMGGAAPQVSAPQPQAQPSPPAQAPQSAPVAQAQPLAPAVPQAEATAGRPAVASPPGFPSKERPPGFAPVPEAVYLWTAPASEGIPLWGLLVQARKREGSNPGRLVIQLVQPAYAFTRAGKRIVVQPGGLVMLTLTDSLEPFVPLAENKEHCVMLWIRALGEIPVDGGGVVYAYDVLWETVPENGNMKLYERAKLARR